MREQPGCTWELRNIQDLPFGLHVEPPAPNNLWLIPLGFPNQNMCCNISCLDSDTVDSKSGPPWKIHSLLWYSHWVACGWVKLHLRASVNHRQPGAQEGGSSCKEIKVSLVGGAPPAVGSIRMSVPVGNSLHSQKPRWDRTCHLLLPYSLVPSPMWPQLFVSCAQKDLTVLSPLQMEN